MNENLLFNIKHIHTIYIYIYIYIYTHIYCIRKDKNVINYYFYKIKQNVSR